MQERAACVHIAKDGRASFDGLRGDGIKLLWILICKV